MPGPENFDHTSKRYGQDLERVKSKVLEMGGFVQEQLRRALKALIDGDSALGLAVASEDATVNAMELAIDDHCSRVLATRSPTAGDLRLIVAVIKAGADLERIGDECQKLGYIGAKLAALERPSNHYAEIDRLGQQVLSGVHNALDAFARMDAALALATARKDRAIDDLHKAVQRQCVAEMQCVAEIPSNAVSIDRLLETMWTARSLERIGDHAKNICEFVIYVVIGRDVRHMSLDDVASEVALVVGRSTRLQ
jgi:phosphate transport system protein